MRAEPVYRKMSSFVDNFIGIEEEEEEEELYLTPNRQMYNASHIIYKIKLTIINQTDVNVKITTRSTGIAGVDEITYSREMYEAGAHCKTKDWEYTFPPGWG